MAGLGKWQHLQGPPRIVRSCVDPSANVFFHLLSRSESADGNSATPPPTEGQPAGTPPSSDGNVYTPIDPVSSSAGSAGFNHGAKPGPSFQEVALKYGTDKVTTHKYQFMYEKYLNPLQGKKLKMLEIGLGCNMVSFLCLLWFSRPLLFFLAVFR
jgi:hypothetical protein